MSHAPRTPLVTPTEGEVEEGSRRTTSPTTNVAEVRGDGGGGLVDLKVLQERLQSRGVQTSLQSLLTLCPAESIVRTIDWWDGQETAGAGVLVETIRRGGVAERKRQSAREYADEVRDWLLKHFPDLTERSGNPHPAAVVQVIHLHHELGKGRLLPREHASRIRVAVRAFNEKWDYSPTEGGSS